MTAAQEQNLARVDQLIARAIQDIRADKPNHAIGKLSAARGVIVLVEKPIAR